MSFSGFAENALTLSLGDGSVDAAELCAGYGGLHLGLRLAGWPVRLAWYAELGSAAQVMATHYPGVPNVGDITTAQFSAQEPVELVTAGWPCQPVSGAGRQLGRADERWIWPHVARGLRIQRPMWFFGENVPRLLTLDKGSLMGEVLADLHRLGYSAVWAVVGACRIGAPHHRHRLFILAHRTERPAPSGAPLALYDDGRWVSPQAGLFDAGRPVVWPMAGVMTDGAAYAQTPEPCGASSTGRRDLAAVLLPTPLARSGDDRGLPSAGLAADRFASGRRNLDDAVALLPTPKASDGAKGGPNQRGSKGDLALPSAVQLLPTPTASPYGSNQSPSPGAAVRPSLEAIAPLLPTPTARDANRGRGRTSPEGRPLSEAIALLPTPTARRGRYAHAVATWERITETPAPEPTEPGARGGPRLAPAFVEWMQGLPAGHVTAVDGLSRAEQLCHLGNGVVPHAAAFAARLLAPRLLAARK